MSGHKNNLDRMMCLDVFLLSLAQQKELPPKDICKSASLSYSLLSLDILAMALQQNKENGFKKLDRQTLLLFAQRFGWQLDMQDLLSYHYSALVLTDINQQIQWVNKGFSQMSGYSRKYALGKKPSFLQGELTCVKTKNRIREKLTNQLTFTEEVINYRKSGEIYLCQVQITPIINNEGALTHFIALENELKF